MPTCCDFHSQGGHSDYFCGSGEDAVGHLRHSYTCTYSAGGDCTCGSHPYDEGCDEDPPDTTSTLVVVHCEHDSDIPCNTVGCGEKSTVIEFDDILF